MLRCNLATLTGLLAGLALGPALAETAEIGTLTCTLVELQTKPGAPEPGGQFRNGRCSFTPREGPEEVYDAKVEGISLTRTEEEGRGLQMAP